MEVPFLLGNRHVLSRRLSRGGGVADIALSAIADIGLEPQRITGLPWTLRLKAWEMGNFTNQSSGFQ